MILLRGQYVLERKSDLRSRYKAVMFLEQGLAGLQVPASIADAGKHSFRVAVLESILGSIMAVLLSFIHTE